MRPADTLDGWLTKGELAQLLGVAPSTVSGWVRAGLPTEGAGPRAKVHVRSALEWIVANLDPFSQAIDRTPGFTRAEQLLQGARRAQPRTPPGWEVMDQLRHPFDRGFVAAMLHAGYNIQWIVATTAVDRGVPIDKAAELADVVMIFLEVTLEDLAARWGVGHWDVFDDAKALPRDHRAYGHVNWPRLAHQSGQPDWTPPLYGTGWLQLSPERRAELVRQGEERDAARDAAGVRDG